MATKIVNGGLVMPSSALTAYAGVPKYIGWGSGTGTTAVTDSSLFVEKDVDISGTSGSRTTGTAATATTTATGDTFQVTGTRTATGAGTITNAGLFDNATIASGTLFLKGDFAGIGLAAADSIAFTIKAVFSSA